jgi:hypothetical protein
MKITAFNSKRLLPGLSGLVEGVLLITARFEKCIFKFDVILGISKKLKQKGGFNRLNP